MLSSDETSNEGRYIHELPNPPFSKARCLQLESGVAPDFDSQTDEELKRELWERHVEVRGRHKSSASYQRSEIAGSDGLEDIPRLESGDC
jgi:hypothetical protein